MPVTPGGPGGLLPGAVLVTLLTCGQMLLVPAARGLVPDLVDGRHLGLATGALSSVSGLAVLGGSAASGLLLQAPAPVLWARWPPYRWRGRWRRGCCRPGGAAVRRARCGVGVSKEP